jgi:hypothetical protein
MPEVYAEINIRWARLVGISAITGLLDTVGTSVADPRPNSHEHAEVRRAIHFALTKCLWDAFEVSEFADLDGMDWGDFELRLDGTAEWYIKRMNKWPRAASEKTQSTARIRLA